jgi:fructokinase
LVHENLGSITMQPAQESIVVGLGELLWDCFAESRRPGGAPANVAFQACQMGGRGIVCSRVGCDPLGDGLVEFLARQKLSTDFVQRDADRPTGTVTVDTSHADHPTYVIHEDVAWDRIQANEALCDLMARAHAVCFGTLAQRSAASRQAIYRALDSVQPNCLVVYDVNLRQRWYERSWVEESLRRSRIVKLNADEVPVIGQLLDLDAAPHDPRSFAHALYERFPIDTVCITRAEKGCLLIDRTASVDQPGVPVKVADAVGAGDAFAAALIIARLRHWPLIAQAAFANQVGALVASRPGAMPILGPELATLVRQFQ